MHDAADRSDTMFRWLIFFIIVSIANFTWTSKIYMTAFNCLQSTDTIISANYNCWGGIRELTSLQS